MIIYSIKELKKFVAQLPDEGGIFIRGLDEHSTHYSSVENIALSFESVWMRGVCVGERKDSKTVRFSKTDPLNFEVDCLIIKPARNL